MPALLCESQTIVHIVHGPAPAMNRIPSAGDDGKQRRREGCEGPIRALRPAETDARDEADMRPDPPRRGGGDRPKPGAALPSTPGDHVERDWREDRGRPKSVERERCLRRNSVSRPHGLAGQPSRIDDREDPDADDRLAIRVILDFGAGFIDHRGWFVNAGT